MDSDLSKVSVSSSVRKYKKPKKKQSDLSVVLDKGKKLMNLNQKIQEIKNVRKNTSLLIVLNVLIADDKVYNIGCLSEILTEYHKANRSQIEKIVIH